MLRSPRSGPDDSPVARLRRHGSRRGLTIASVVIGLAALLGMLTSCASNVTVVNIDNGFGAAYVATLINRL